MSKLDKKLKAVVAHAYANAPAVRDRFDKAGLKPNQIQTVGDLSKLPVLEKDEVIALQQANPPFGGMLGVPTSEIHHIFMSPGPIYEPDADDDEEIWDVAVDVLKAAGFTPDDVVLNTLSYHLVPAGSLLDTALTRLGCTVVPSGYGNTDLQLKLMGDLKVTGYVGTPSFLIHLIKRAEETGLTFNEAFKLNKALVSAEPLPADLRNTFVEQYGISICNTYATAELGLLAYNIVEGLTMDLLPQPIIQLVDPDTGQEVEPGEVGEIVVTNFSKVYPLLRFGTGDLAINVDSTNGEGAQEERQIIIVGRRGDAVKVRGMFVHPTQLRYAISLVAKGMGIAPPALQGAVQRPDHRDVFIVRLALQDAAQQAAIEEPAKQAIQQACRVRVDEIEFVESIDPSARPMVDERDLYGV